MLELFIVLYSSIMPDVPTTIINKAVMNWESSSSLNNVFDNDVNIQSISPYARKNSMMLSYGSMCSLAWWACDWLLLTIWQFCDALEPYTSYIQTNLFMI